MKGRDGCKRRLGVEDESRQLILVGMGTVEGLQGGWGWPEDRYRWRAEHGGLPPRRRTERERSGRYLALLVRQGIATLHEQGLSLREIARRLGGAPLNGQR